MQVLRMMSIISVMTQIIANLTNNPIRVYPQKNTKERNNYRLQEETFHQASVHYSPKRLNPWLRNIQPFSKQYSNILMLFAFICLSENERSKSYSSCINKRGIHIKQIALFNCIGVQNMPIKKEFNKLGVIMSQLLLLVVQSWIYEVRDCRFAIIHQENKANHMKTVSSFPFVRVSSPVKKPLNSPLDRFKTRQNDNSLQIQNNLNCPEFSGQSTHSVTGPDAVLDKYVKNSQKEDHCLPRIQYPIKSKRREQIFQHAAALIIPTIRISCVNSNPITSHRTPQSNKCMNSSWFQTHKHNSNPLKSANNLTSKSERYSHQIPKTTEATFDSVCTSSIKLELPRFPHPKLSDYNSKLSEFYLSRPLADNQKFNKIDLSNSQTLQTRTCPSTPNSIADISSPWGSETEKQYEFHEKTRSQREFLSTDAKKQLRLEDFDMVRELGRGKYGIVTMVKHKKTGFLCALKTLKKSLIKQENVLGQLIREIKIQSSLDHPNIIKLYGFFHSKENIYLVMELSSQGQLYSILQQKKRIDENNVAGILKQLSQAIKYLQSKSVMHRDIKPENIVFQKGEVKLCDFGWSVHKGNSLRTTFCGTPLYISPEVLKGDRYDEKSDIWSLGIIAYEMLVGTIPFNIETKQELRKIIEDDFTFPSELKISDKAQDFVFKILKKNPMERLKIQAILNHPFIRLCDGSVKL